MLIGEVLLIVIWLSPPRAFLRELAATLRLLKKYSEVGSCFLNGASVLGGLLLLGLVLQGIVNVAPNQTQSLPRPPPIHFS